MSKVDVNDICYALFFLKNAELRFFKMAKSYVSQTQLEHLLTFMENNPTLAKNYTPKSTQGRFELTRLWKKLADQLNSLGFPNKSVQEWRRYWTEYKYRSKKKFSKNILSKNKTGGGPAEEVPLDPIEERVVSVARIKNAVLGNGGNSFGATKRPHPVEIEVVNNRYATNSKQDDMDNDFENVEYLDEDPLEYEPPEINDSFNESEPSLPECPSKSPQERPSKPPEKFPLPPKRRYESSEQLTNTLLQQQIDNDEKFQTEVIQILKERNKQDLNFQTKIIELFEEKVALEKQKAQSYNFDD